MALNDNFNYGKDIRKHPKKSGLSEKSKTFTIESLLKSDQKKLFESSENKITSERTVMQVPIKADIIPSDLWTRLDFARRHQDPQIFNWLRMQSPTSSAHSIYNLQGAFKLNSLSPGVNLELPINMFSR